MMFDACGPPCVSGVTALVPLPRTCDDLVELAELRSPAKLGLDLLGTSYQNGGISGAAFALFHRDGAAGNAAHRIDDLANGEPLAIADVVDHAAVLTKRLQCEEVGLGKVADVDVVADAGAVFGGV